MTQAVIDQRAAVVGRGRVLDGLEKGPQRAIEAAQACSNERVLPGLNLMRVSVRS